MVIVTGSCRFGLWHIHVTWQGNLVYRVRFAREGVVGPIPEEIRRYCAGRSADLSSLESVATEGESTFAKIYRAVRAIPCGETATYGEIARIVGTAPRVVGSAMARNPTPIVYPATASSRRPALEGSPRIWRSKRPCSPWSGARPDPARREMRGINW